MLRTTASQKPSLYLTLDVLQDIGRVKCAIFSDSLQEVGSAFYMTWISGGGGERDLSVSTCITMITSIYIVFSVKH